MRFLCLPGLLCLVWLWVSPVQAAGRPNVLLILADDMAWGDVHSHGNAKIDTPNLDRLAGDGAWPACPGASWAALGAVSPDPHRPGW